LRSPTCRDRRASRRGKNPKYRGGRGGGGNGREEGEGKDGSLYPLEFSKVGAYVQGS